MKWNAFGSEFRACLIQKVVLGLSRIGTLFTKFISIPIIKKSILLIIKIFRKLSPMFMPKSWKSYPFRQHIPSTQNILRENIGGKAYHKFLTEQYLDFFIEHLQYIWPGLYAYGIPWSSVQGLDYAGELKQV